MDSTTPEPQAGAGPRPNGASPEEPIESLAPSARSKSEKVGLALLILIPLLPILLGLARLFADGMGSG